MTDGASTVYLIATSYEGEACLVGSYPFLGFENTWSMLQSVWYEGSHTLLWVLAVTVVNSEVVLLRSIEFGVGKIPTDLNATLVRCLLDRS
jgi:hypothetical protein